MRTATLSTHVIELRWRRLLAIAAAASALLALMASGVQAQRVSGRTAGVHVAPYAGVFMSGNMFDGPAGTSLGSATGPLVGAQMGVDITPNIAVVGNIGYSSSDLEVGVPFLGGIGVGRSNVWLYDGALQLSAPFTTGGGMGLRPFVQGGAGGITQRVESGLIGTDATSFAWNVGAGVDLQFSRNVGLRIMARDYISRFDTREAIGFEVGNSMKHNWGITAGLKLGF